MMKMMMMMMMMMMTTTTIVFLGPLAKLWKATYSFVISVHPFVRMEQIRSQRTDFREI
jgi:hypothetical protein